MKQFVKIFFITFFICITAAAASKSLQGDNWKSSDLTKTFLPPSTSTTLLGTDTSQSVTNKIISGSNNTISNIALSTDVTGVLSISKGGTGQTTQTAAFNGLSPLTTKGDLIVRNASGDNTRKAVGADGYILVADSSDSTGVKWVQQSVTSVAGTLPIANGGTGQTTKTTAYDALSPNTTKGDITVRNGTVNVRRSVGTDGQVLIADSSDATGVKWATPSTVSTANVISKTTTYTAVVGDDIINASGSAFTITLYAASGNSGKSITIKKTDSSFTNIITIDGNASETIDGALTTTLNTQYESITLYCDGSNWFKKSRDIPNKWLAYTPTINGMGTPTSVNFVWKRVGDSIQIIGSFITGTPSAATSEFTLPSGLTADSGVITTYAYYGDWTRVVSTGSTRKRGKNVISGGSSTIGMTSDDYTTALGPASALAGNAGFGSSESVKVQALNIPITGWN